MRKEFNRAHFVDFSDRNSGRVYSDMEFKYCRFESCNISLTYNPKKRTTVQNMAFIGCEVRGCSIKTAIIEDVLVSSLKTHTLLQTWGAVFKHVKLEGNIGRIMTSPVVSIWKDRPRQQAAFDKANAEYYQNVDWALDISEGRFMECEIQRVPAKIIRRDTETQVVIYREKVLDGEWKKIDLSKTYWATSIEFFLERGDPDLVLVAPKRHSKFPDLLDGLKKLRDAGVAEPD